MKHRIVLIFLLLACALGLPAKAAPLSGTKSVGPTGNYASLTAAIADIQAQTLGGAFTLELQPAYASTVETFPLVFTNLTTTAANTLTLRPQTGAVNLVITSANTTAATMDLNGAQYLTLDGRPGGTGTVKQLTIANTSTSGVTVRFINDGRNNFLRYLTLQGVNISPSSGTVVFSSTTGANGNDNNTIDTCDVRDGATTPANGIYALGTTTTAAQSNSGNTVANCNIFNFYASVDAAGVRIEGGNTDWSVTGNSFYQTASRAAVAANVRGILINNIAGNNFNVTGNFIGGSAASVGGIWTTTGTSAASLFQGIQINVGNTTASSVQGNTIKNFTWTSSSGAVTLPGIWSGIHVQAGNVNIGTVTGNFIGSGTGTGSISVTTSGSGGTTFGIGSASSGTVAIANNAVGSITTSGSAPTISASLVGIRVTAGANTIAGNTVGSTTTANSLAAATSSTETTFGQQVAGILSASSTSASITGNTVANLNNNYVGTSSGRISGIETSAGVNTIVGNTVRNLSTTSQDPFEQTSASVLGISQSSIGAGQTVSQNVVHSLANTAATAAVVVIGINYSCSTDGINLIARNLVHSLSVASTGTARVRGMYLIGGRFTAQNNMVRVGFDASGASTAGASIVEGILDIGSAAGRNIYHNSVYVGGTEITGASSTFAFNGTGSVTARDFRNNIFVNARSNSGGTGKHYAVQYSGTIANPAGLTAGNNLFFVSGTGGVLGSYNGTDRTTLAAWQVATGQDVSSAVADPRFVNPTGNAGAVDLHLQASNPAEGGGVPIAAVTDDFDGQTRSSFTPVDIGADAGSFTSSSGDIYAPFISYPLLFSANTANRTLTGWATIVDNSGTVSGGANAPRLYYKKSTDADAFLGNTAADNGWKYVVGTNGGSGSYSFTIDYSLITGGSVSVGDTIQYFVVTQDAANKLASHPAAATASASPPVQNINGKPSAGVNSYNIMATLTGGTVTVGGAGSAYPSLSGAFGLFDALNASGLTGNLTVKITGDTTEDGSMVLNAFTVPYTVTIQPDSATMRTISGSVANGLIILNGANRVTIDGAFGGSGRYLTFRNTSTVGATIIFINDASNNNVRNCVVEGATTSGAAGVVFFSKGVTTGNDNNTVTGNQIRDRSDASGVPGYLVYSSGTSDTVANSSNTVSNNEMFNFASIGVRVDFGNDSWSVTGNTIYRTASAPPAGPLIGIELRAFGTNTIRGNTVRDLTTSYISFGIFLPDKTGNTTVAGNRVWNIGNTPGSTSAAVGIELSWNPLSSAGQSVTMVNNMFVLSSSGTTAQRLCGIAEGGVAGSTAVIAFNTVIITGTGGAGADTRAFFSGGASTATVKNNVFLNLRTGGGNHFAANRLPGSTGPLTMDYNVYAGTGLTTAANFFDSSNGSGATGTPISYAQWQANVPSDTHSSASNPGGNFTSAMFVDAANGDLHLVPGGNLLVNNAGTPIAGVTTDYDGETRWPAAPYVGADELISHIADLTNLALSSGTLNPAFASGTLSYAASVANGTGSVTVTPAVASSFATVTVNTASAATPVALSIGTNSIPVLVTAQDGVTMKNYNVIVTRRTVFQDWAVVNAISSDPAASGANQVMNLHNFAFGMNPNNGAAGALVFSGSFGGGGTIGSFGLPITKVEPPVIGTDFRALYVRRKDAASIGLVYVPEFSDALATWAPGVPPTVLADDGTYQIVSVPFPTWYGIQGEIFFRVRTTLAP